MKVTKAEVKKSMEELLGYSVSCDIRLGVESDGDMVVVVIWSEVTRHFATAFSMSVIKLAKKHGEKYTPFIMGDDMYVRYKWANGFVEVEEEAFPIELVWDDGLVSMAMRTCGADDGFIAVTETALEAFCWDCIERIDKRRNAKE